MTPNQPTTGLPDKPWLVNFALFEIGFLIAYRFGMTFSETLASPMWFPDSVLLCVLLVSRPNRWWLYILGTLPIRFFLFVPSGTPVWFLTACFVNDSLKAVLTAWFLGRISRPARWLDDLGNFSRYFLIAVILSPALSAVAGAASRIYLGDQFGTAWTNWFLGDALAGLILTPLLVHLDTEFPRINRLNFARFAKALFIAAGLAVALYLAFHRGLDSGVYSPLLLYVTVPFLLGAGVFFGLTGATSALLLVSLVAIFGTLDGRGPFYESTAAASLLSIQLFLFFVAVPFMFLSVLINQQRKTDKSLRESEQRFRSMVDTAPVMVWMAGIDGSCAFFNKPWLDFTGHNLKQELEDGWAASIHPQDREDWAAQYKSALESRKSFTREYRLLRGDGVYRWVLENGIPRYGTADDDFLGYIASCIDITARKETEDRLRHLSSQLIHAQETERFRIGQELHDDLAQRAAALAIGLKHLARRYDDGVRPSFEELQQQATELCRGVSNISHQLRPPALETLGLAAALQNLCSQSTGPAHTVRFIGDDRFPPLSDEVAISLYRVAQEAVRNALTHSGADVVKVELRVSESGVGLSITDKGRGFLTDPTALSGLGLAGMGERMRNAGGNLSILSTPGNGTTVTATVPAGKAVRAAAQRN